MSQFTRSLDRWRAQGGLVLLYGDQAVLAYALQAIASLLARGEHVVFIDSANAFNPLLIAEVATRLNKPPEELLNRLHISRTFTVHQLEAIITERIRSALNTYTSRVLIASWFLNNLYDEDVALPEAWRIFRKTVAHLRTLADAGTLVLVICPAPAARLPDRDRLLDALIAEADKIIKLEVATLSLEKPVPVSVSPPNISSPKRLDRLPGLEYEPRLSLPLGKEDSMGIPTGTGSSNAPCIRIPVGGGILLSSPLRHDSRPL